MIRYFRNFKTHIIIILEMNIEKPKLRYRIKADHIQQVLNLEPVF